MKALLKKIFQNKKISSDKDLKFQDLKNNKGVYKIFGAINNYNETSEIRYVGGCVRKILNDEKTDDIDLATNLTPDQVKQCLDKNQIKFFETGIEHGTITAVIDDQNFEITTLRKDVKTDGRHAVVEYTTNWKEDSLRRDFSINSIYSDLDGNLYDPNSGHKDLNVGIIKFIGDPETRIKEDYLRIIRYLRFYTEYSKIDHEINIIKIIKKNIEGLGKISKERQFNELKKILKLDNFLKLFKNKTSCELFSLIFPQLKNFKKLSKLSKPQEKILKNKSLNFHARFSAKQRIYTYVIFNRISRPSIEKNRGWHIRKKLDLKLMKKGAKKLLGTHDFSTFRSSICQASTPVKTIDTININSEYIDETCLRVDKCRCISTINKLFFRIHTINQILIVRSHHFPFHF